MGKKLPRGVFFLAVANSWPRQVYGDRAWGFGGDLRWSAADDRAQKRTFRPQTPAVSAPYFSKDVRYQPGSSPL